MKFVEVKNLEKKEKCDYKKKDAFVELIMKLGYKVTLCEYDSDEYVSSVSCRNALDHSAKKLRVPLKFVMINNVVYAIRTDL